MVAKILTAIIVFISVMYYIIYVFYTLFIILKLNSINNYIR